MELLSTLDSDIEKIGEVGVSTPTSGPSLANLIVHIRNPQNMLNYMILSAWLKFMGIAQHIPSVSIG